MVDVDMKLNIRSTGLSAKRCGYVVAELLDKVNDVATPIGECMRA